MSGFNSPDSDWFPRSLREDANSFSSSTSELVINTAAGSTVDAYSLMTWFPGPQVTWNQVQGLGADASQLWNAALLPTNPAMKPCKASTAPKKKKKKSQSIEHARPPQRASQRFHRTGGGRERGSACVPSEVGRTAARRHSRRARSRRRRRRAAIDRRAARGGGGSPRRVAVARGLTSPFLPCERLCRVGRGGGLVVVRARRHGRGGDRRLRGRGRGGVNGVGGPGIWPCMVRAVAVAVGGWSVAERWRTPP